MPGSKSILPVAAFTLVYLSIGLFFAWGQRNFEFLLYIPIVLALGVIVVGIRNRTGFSNGLLWCLSVWGLLHVMGGLVQLPDSWKSASEFRVLYSWEIIPGVLVYDKPVHAFGFAVATWACWQGLKKAAQLTAPTLGTVTLATLAGNGLGAMNEVVEFIASQTLQTNVGGYVNTGGDLVANLLGSLVTGVLVYFWPRSNRDA